MKHRLNGFWGARSIPGLALVLVVSLLLLACSSGSSRSSGADQSDSTGVGDNAIDDSAGDSGIAADRVDGQETQQPGDATDLQVSDLVDQADGVLSDNDLGDLIDSDPGDLVDSGAPDLADSDPGDLVDSGAPDLGDDGQSVDLADSEPPFSWPVPTAPITITPHSSWKNSISYPEEPFLSKFPENFGQPRWVKFSVLMRDPTKVYFQHSSSYPYHYDFATERLNPFLGYDRGQFDAVSLHQQGQEVILGAVLFAPDKTTNEMGIQLVRQDAYRPEMVKIVFELVRKNIKSATNPELFYFPTYEQQQSTIDHATFFESNNIPVSSAERWALGNTCYTRGWALGRLVFVAADQIQDAYEAGTLKPEDILLTDAVPAEVPFVAGILTLSASTPNSHVAILSASYAIPFAHLVLSDDAALAKSLVGKIVAFRTTSAFGGCSVGIFNVDGLLSAGERDEILKLKSPAAVNFDAKQTLGSYSKPASGLKPSDIVYFGGKAANFGMLLTAIPDNSPTEAIGLSFDLWDQFMQQQMPSGNTLQSDINTILSAHSWPPEMKKLADDLKTIRDMIEDDTVFSQELQTAIVTSLSGFDPKRKIRFRSSTNVEDSDSFTGAGLYDSNSGCLADDQDGDEDGPSICDPGKSSERGVYRAIRKVYASFYNFNAFIERLRRGVDESKVGMALLVHYSFPDPIEMANGVVTYNNPGTHGKRMTIVTQLGAESVTNPDGGLVPEELSVSIFSSFTIYTLFQESSLVPLGSHVMDYDADYKKLGELLLKVGDEFTKVTGKQTWLLDFEFKKVVPGKLVVKQVRQLPTPSTEKSVPTYLLPRVVEWCTFQGEYGDVFSNHRLKSRLQLTNAGTWLDKTSTAGTWLTDGTFNTIDNGLPVTIQGAPTGWPEVFHKQDSSNAETVIDGFTVGSDATRRVVELRSDVTRMVSPSASPLLVTTDFPVYLTATWDTPQITLDFQGKLTTVSSETIRLTPCLSEADVTPGHILVSRTISKANLATIVTELYFPPGPKGITAGYTAPLVVWVKTTISGLTTNPIVLKGYYSQTFRPGHHNFNEEFIFEPGLDPDTTELQKSELAGKNIRAIYAYWGGLDDAHRIGFWTLDGKLTFPE